MNPILLSKPVRRIAFRDKVASAGTSPLTALGLTTLQVNVGYRCNLGCTHCHLSAGPTRSESMTRDTMDVVLRALAGNPVQTLDITGGAPELNPHFRSFVVAARQLGKHVIVRTNLSILLEPGMTDLPEFYRTHDVELVASLPCYLERNVDGIRGNGTFKKCVSALKKLNGLGYGREGGIPLNLVYNPNGAFLPPAQAALEQDYKRELGSRYGVFFNKLYAFTNMPIGRFRDRLSRDGNLEAFQDMLACSFNPQTLDRIMCRHLISVGWDGALYDCDFNLALGLPLNPGLPTCIRDFDHAALASRMIAVDDHCYGCTAGQGST